MPSADPTAVIILSEIVFFETIIILGFVLFFFIRKKKIIGKLKTALSDYEKNIPERTSSLKLIYSESPHLQENDIDKLVNDLIENETTFFRSIIGKLNKLDISSISSLEMEMQTLVSPYSQIIKAGDATDTNNAEKESIVPDIDSAIDDLLADEADDADGDPALDLSATSEGDGEIEEIPEELLSDSEENTDESDQEHSSGETSDDEIDPNSLSNDETKTT